MTFGIIMEGLNPLTLLRDPLENFNSDDDCDVDISTSNVPHTSIPGFVSLQDCADDDPILQQFRDQFSSRKRVRKAVQEDDELITIDLSNSDFSKPCPKSSGKKKKKKSAIKSTTKRARKKLESNAEKDDSSIDARPTLKTIYRRSFVDGRYDKMIYAQLKRKYGYRKRKLH
ncbi:hypothetical protein DSO57_1026224 [Entomophthora muscae]|uniref:Uncharacterized protein n=1 Tax=Entomophthora muscae TaxID=34485 RepID=A0ACC2U0P7_9FUNG|nr:hypothetical protein DSO57_1026224 [Entomophthora muscae]